MLEWFLNRERKTWFHPINGERHNESLRELWNNSVSTYIETIEEVNKYLYDGRAFKCRMIDSNYSYDTALSCEEPVKKLIYAKKY